MYYLRANIAIEVGFVMAESSIVSKFSILEQILPLRMVLSWQKVALLQNVVS